MEKIELKDSNDILIEKPNKILKFYTTWCGPCKVLANVLEGYKLDTPITLISINASDFRDLSQKYNISSVPTLIFLNENNQILESYLGGCTLEGFYDLVNKHYGSGKMNKEEL